MRGSSLIRRALARIAPPAGEPESVTIDNLFVEKDIVVTGKVEPCTRDSISAKIKSLGVRVGNSVSGKTGYLVCGENAGSKLGKVRGLGVTVLTPAQFFQIAGCAALISGYLKGSYKKQDGPRGGPSCSFDYAWSEGEEYNTMQCRF